MNAVPVSVPVYTLTAHLQFLGATSLVFLALLTLLRAALLAFNHELVGDTPVRSLLEAFRNGARFDLRLIVYLCLPIALALLWPPLMRAHTWQVAWLTGVASLVILLGVIELNFYQEFQQRLNSLVFQYLQEDPKTVASMLWHGFPVLRLLALWAALTAVCWLGFSWLANHIHTPASSIASEPWLPLPARHALAFLGVTLICVLAARGTLRQGPPLRWGDAYTTESLFANQLGLNGVLSLYTAAKARAAGGHKIHRDTMPLADAQAITRAALVAPHERLVDTDTAAVRRETTPPEVGQLPVKHVVVILMESFAGPFVGALGAQTRNKDAITPRFDQLAQEGLLFRRFFSNGTHTHQGLFASMASFPNLPGFEYLMQMPEGAQGFSGLPQLLSERGYQDLYVYNGDFAWDNQQGFFRNQGMTRFIGRNDYENPVVSDPTWGVSDQDMFDRAAQELKQFDGSASDTKPFYALLQTLSNHTPYALPDVLPVEPVTGHGALNPHLTAMRYADWALGRFFDQIRNAPWFDETLFVLIGDHGFGVPAQLTDINLLRFHVPMLMIAPGIRETFGATNDTVGSQVDMVPTIMGRLGGVTQHQCWGRDLLALPADDPGFAVIKPSGSDQTTALVQGDQILVQPQGLAAKLYRYQLGVDVASTARADVIAGENGDVLAKQLAAYLQSATHSLLNHTAGARAAAAEMP